MRDSETDAKTIRKILVIGRPIGPKDRLFRAARAALVGGPYRPTMFVCVVSS
jgi:hypothetical protein